MDTRLTCGEYEELKKAYITGWRTWNVNSVLSYVHMPDAFAVNLCVKEYREGRYLREALIGQFPDVTGTWPKEVLYPGDHALDDSYTSMKVSWCGLEFLVETAQEDEAFHILVTPVKCQIKPALLVLETGYMWNRPGAVRKSGEELTASGGGSAYRIWSSNETAEDDPNLPSMTQYLSVHLTEAAAFSVETVTGAKKRERKTVQEIEEIIRKKREALRLRYTKCGELHWIRQAMECAIAWDTVYDARHDRVISPVSRLWSIRSGGYVLFCWDTFFAALLAAESGCRELAFSNLIEILNEKTGAGFVPNLAYGTGQKSEDRSQPPVGSRMLLAVYRKYREQWIVRLMLPWLFEWNTWFWEHRRSKSGALCWGSDPTPVLYGNRWESDGVHDRFGAALESGLDNSPMYDEVPFNPETNMLELEDVGLTGLFIMDCDALMELCQIAGDLSYIADLNERKKTAQQGLSQLWDEEFGFFCNRRTDTGEFSRRISPTNFYALFSDGLSERQLERIIKEHYYNPEEFYGEWMLPSIARNDPAFPDQDYWRGRVWAPLNFLVWLALEKQERKKECRDLADKSAAVFRKEWDEHRHVHENYNALTGEGCDALNSDKFYHWGALMAVIALMEERTLSRNSVDREGSNEPEQR